MSGEAERTSVFILGLGLIGGSLALALTASGHYRVVGCDRDAETLRKALAAGALAGEGTEEALAQAELVILAVPPQAAAAFLREQATNLRPEAVVTDVCGVKASVVEQCAPLCRRAGAVFVGGHPMAGKEVSGFDAAEACIVKTSPTPEGWKAEKWMEYPYLHRFDIVEIQGRQFLVACQLCKAKAFRDDGSSPGVTAVGEMDGDRPPRDMQPIIPSLTKNHGFCRTM